MKISLSIFFLLLYEICLCQIPSLDWLKSISSSNSVAFRSVAIDANGYIFTSRENGLSGPISITKTSDNGTIIWDKQISAKSASSIKVDSLSNIYLTGYYNGTVDFDPGAGVANLSSDGNMNIYIAKYDSSGTYLWAKSIEGNFNNMAYDYNFNSIFKGVRLDLDNQGALFLTGSFIDTVDFDPSSNFVNLFAYDEDIFFAKFDTLGNLIWAKNLQGAGEDVAKSIAINNVGEIFISGYYHINLDFDPSINISNDNSPTFTKKAYLAKYSNNGSLLWFRVIKTDQLYPGVNQIAINQNNEISIIGNFKYNLVLENNGSDSLLGSSSNEACYVMQFSDSGNLQFTKIFENFHGTTIIHDTFNNIYFGGEYSSLSDDYFNSLYIYKLSSIGDSIWYSRFSSNPDNARFLYELAINDIQNLFYITYESSYTNKYTKLYKLTPCISTSSIVNITVCGQYLAPNGTILDSTGTYSISIMNRNGCDSLITINLIVIQNPFSTMVINVCDSYTAPDNQIYTQSGNYTAVIPNPQGCDSIITLDLTIKNQTYSNIVESVCSSYTAPDNQVYTLSGTYTAIIPNASGCDSIITINLTVNNPSFSSITETVCNSYTAPDNQVYTLSGTYTAIIPNVSGCDSTITINLSVNNASFSSITETVCNSYTAPDNQIYTQSGTYTAIIPNVSGCDSMITINLTVNNPSFSSITETVCNSYTAPDNQIYTQSGTFTAIIQNIQGCDSTITIDLTVANLAATITQTDSSLNSTISNASYQWIDCLNGNQSIQNENNQSFTPVVNGEYAVIVSQNSCSDTSDCMLVSNVGLLNLTIESINIKPNPTSDYLSISFEEVKSNISYKIYSISGQLMEAKSCWYQKNLDLDVRTYSNGIYLLELDFGAYKETFKILKE